MPGDERFHLFFGRVDTVAQIFDLWERFPLQHIALIGPRRSGRTSLLNYLMNIASASPEEVRPQQRTNWLSQPQAYRWVLVNFQNPMMRQRSSLLGYLLKKLEISIPEPCDLIRFMEAVSDHPLKRTIILMDDIEKGLAAPELDQEFWWGLRALASDTKGKVGIILAAQGIPDEVAAAYGKPSPFFNIFGHTIELKPLKEREARELIASSPIPFPAADVEWILQHSRGWPALVQLCCDIRLRALQKGDTSHSWRQEALRLINENKSRPSNDREPLVEGYNLPFILAQILCLALIAKLTTSRLFSKKSDTL